MIGDNFDVDLSNLDQETLQGVQTLYEQEAMSRLVQNLEHRELLGQANRAGAIRPLGSPGIRFSPTTLDYLWLQRFHKEDMDNPDFVRWWQSTDAGSYSRVSSRPEKVMVGFTGERRVVFRKTY